MDDSLDHSLDPTSAGQGPVGKYIGPYQVEAELGRGAMGVVFQVRRGGGGPPLAMKVLLPEVLHDEVGADRFLIEAQTMSRLGDHPGIVAVIDYGRTPRGMPYYVMEFVPGQTLRQLSRTLSERPRLELIQQVARALEHAHDQGFVHRDVKPDNVMVTEDGRALLTDFGIARVLGGSQALTRTGDILGTPVYMAPELATPGMGEVGPQADVFSLGAMIYEVLTGRTPYTGKTAVGIFTKLLEGHPIPSVRSGRPNLRPEMHLILERALAREQDDRYPDAGALADDLEVVLGMGDLDVAPRSSAAWIAALVAVLLVIGLAVGAVKLLSGPPPPPPTSAQAQLLEQGELLELLEQLKSAEAWKDPGLQLLAPHDRARLAAWTGAATQVRETALGEVEPEARRQALRWELRRFTGVTPEETGALTQAIGTGWAGLAQGEEALARGLSGVAAQVFARVAGEETDPALVLTARLGQARAWLALGDLTEADRALAAARDAELQPAGPDLRRARWQLVARRVLRAADPEQAKALSGAGDRDRRLPRLVTIAARKRAELKTTDSFELSSAAELDACARGLDGAEGLLLAHACRLALAAEEGNHRASARRAAELLEGLALRVREDSPSGWIALARARMVLHEARKADPASKRALELAPRDPLSLLVAADVVAALNAYWLDAKQDFAAQAKNLSELPHKLTQAINNYRRLYPKLGPALQRAVRLRVARQLLERARVKALLQGGLEATPIELRKQLREELEEELGPLLRSRAKQTVDINELSGIRASAVYSLSGLKAGMLSQRMEALARAAAPATRSELEALRLRIGAGDQSSPQHAAAYLGLTGDLPAMGILRVRRLERDRRDKAAQDSLRSWVRIERTLQPPYVRLRAEELIGDRGRTTASLRKLARVVLDGPELTLHVLGLLARGKPPNLPEAGDDPLDRLARAVGSRTTPLAGLLPDAASETVSPERARGALLDAHAAVAGFPDRAGVYLIRAGIRLAAGPAAAPIRLRSRQDVEVARASAPWAWPTLRLLSHLTEQPSPELRETLLMWGLLDGAQDPRAAQVKAILSRTNPLGVEKEIEKLAGPRLRLALRLHALLAWGYSPLEIPSDKDLAGNPPLWRAAALTALSRFKAQQLVQRDRSQLDQAAQEVLSAGLPAIQLSAPQGRGAPLRRRAVLAAGTMPTDPAERARTGAPSHPALWRAAYWLQTGEGVLGELAQGYELVRNRLEELRDAPSLFQPLSNNTGMLHTAQTPYTRWAADWLIKKGPREVQDKRRFAERSFEVFSAAHRSVAFLRGRDPAAGFYELVQKSLRLRSLQLGDRGRGEDVNRYLRNHVATCVGPSPLLESVRFDLTLDEFGWAWRFKMQERVQQLVPKIQRALAKLPPLRDDPVDPKPFQLWRRIRACASLNRVAEARTFMTQLARNGRLELSPLLRFYVQADPLLPALERVFPGLRAFRRR